MIKAGIIGGAGYTGGELIRILLAHPKVEIDFVYSTSQAGNPITSVHHDLLGYTGLNFTDKINEDADVVFLCVGHGISRQFLNHHPRLLNTRIIDLSTDFRHYGDHDFVYGLPELNRERIRQAVHVANPGCFATAIQLALLPVAKAQKLAGQIHINAMTGSTGAGQSLSETSHFTWRNDNISTYKVFEHQHEQEILQSLTELDQANNRELYFVPLRGNFTRGIMATVYFDAFGTEKELVGLFARYYEHHPFTQVTTGDIYLKQVVNTNQCILLPSVKKDKIFITSIIDNLVKGASGQAVQNMNLMFGLDEWTGLHLKPIGL